MNEPMTPRASRSKRAAVLALSLLVGCEQPAPKTGADDTSARATSTAAQASSTAAPDGASAELTEIAITKRYPAVGDKRATTQVGVSQRKTDISGPKGKLSKESTETTRHERSEECLAVDGKRCTKLTVTYAKSQKKVATKDGKTEETQLPHAGQTFNVELKGDSVTVTDAGGKSPPAATLDAVMADLDSMAGDVQVLEALPEKVKIGDSLDGVAKVLASQASAGERPPASLETKVTVKAIKDGGSKKVVVLDVAFSFVLDDAESGSKSQVTTQGTFELRADTGLPVKRELKGPMKVTFDGTGKSKLTGTIEGQLSTTWADSYSF
jgi:uncharacterized protein YceK